MPDYWPWLIVPALLLYAVMGAVTAGLWARFVPDLHGDGDALSCLGAFWPLTLAALSFFGIGIALCVGLMMCYSIASGEDW